MRKLTVENRRYRVRQRSDGRLEMAGVGILGWRTLPGGVSLDSPLKILRDVMAVIVAGERQACANAAAVVAKRVANGAAGIGRS